LAEIRNPNLQGRGNNQGPGGSSGLLVFTMIALIAVLGYQMLFKPKPAPQAPQQQSQQNQQATPAPAATSAQTSTATVPALPTIAATTVTETTVENAEYRIVFSNQGAAVKQWILKGYKDSNGKPLDMVQAQSAERFGRPLDLYTYEPALTQQLNKALYQVSFTGAQPIGGVVTVPATSALTFHYSDGSLDVVKTVRFGSGYVVTVEAQVKRNGVPVRSLVSWPAGLGDMEEFSSGQGHNMAFARTPTEFAWSVNGKQDTLAAGKVSGNATLDVPYEYAAFTDLYFTAAFLPDVPQRTTLVTLHNTIDLATDPEDANSQKKPADVLGLAMGDVSGFTRVRLYAGPKQLDVLKTIHSVATNGGNGPSLDKLVQFGWLTVIAKPLYLALRWVRELLKEGSYSWGWAIILVTVVFYLALLPTRLIMMKSSLKMMRIQPKVEAIKRKYQHLKATDPKRAEMNQEMMALYKTEGVNMYGSCLPALFQMPLFFAYYRVLYNAVELRQADWFWLHDLSAADPWHILPAIIIVTMFLTQYITPAPGMDPAQRRMMAFLLPVVFGFSMWHFASGLALYWCTGNLINMGIQIAINMSPIGREMHEIAARREAKKSGARTIQGRR
jgi:YidC/Oxa1 family membrane protein insertase